MRSARCLARAPVSSALSPSPHPRLLSPPMDISAFIEKWSASSGSEAANKDAFLLDLCDVLDVPRPNPTTGRAIDDRYVFEKDARMRAEDGTISVGKMDLYKEDCFILEAKQGSDQDSEKRGIARRGTPGWTNAMSAALGQARGYARTLDRHVPFLIVCDIGYCFDLFASFDGSRHRPLFNAQHARIYLRDLENPEHYETLRQVFLDPYSLDASKRAAKVTTEVSEKLAKVATDLEKSGYDPEVVAKFLLRCLFTMFAEDIGLLPPRLFTDAIQDRWIPKPETFTTGVESLWRSMNSGSDFGYAGKLLRFNGSLFEEPVALPLTRQQLALLLDAAEQNWAEVEPAIFGTLIERALSKKERHALGAHYTPRAYVERLVRPTIEEPLRADWELVQIEARHLIDKDKVEAARKLVRQFHQKLCKIRVLDPACGSGNFLYVALDLFLRLESEILAFLEDIGDKQTLLHADTIRVTPGQFLGIEIKFLAKQIAELVLWIGYLQHHFRAYGKKIPPPEPVLQDYKNIEWRDAVLAYDARELVRDESGKPISRWDGETYKKSPVTGEDVPDEEAKVPVYRYVNPRKAEWPKADFIVGNPPYIGARRIRSTLGDEYVNTLRSVYSEVPDTVDLVMYWWDRAAALVGKHEANRFGFITTNSITQEYSRPIIDAHLRSDSVQLIFAVADHPWIESKDGAAIRVAITVGTARSTSTAPLVGKVVGEDLVFSRTTRINSMLTSGSSVRDVLRLQANQGLCYQGIVPAGDGFKLSLEDVDSFGLNVESLPHSVKPYIIGRDLVQRAEERYIIDLFGLDLKEARENWPALYQWVYDRVYPERKLNNRRVYRERWWLFAEPRPKLRNALSRLSRFIATPYTAKFRPFIFVPTSTIPDAMVYAIATDDAWMLGVLSSRVHSTWAVTAGARLGVGNDPRYTSNATFAPFPFPICTDAQADRIRNLGESLDAHRKRQQSLYPKLTITGMYNVIEKLRAGEALSAKEKTIHEEGLVSVLKQIHDDLDAAVFDAYGWPHDLSDEAILERLVALNAERAEEERRGTIRWLRPEFQNPSGQKEATQTSLVEDEAAVMEEAPKTAPIWPRKLPEQVALVRDWLSRHARDGVSAKELAKAFRRGRAKEAELVLDSLAALGIAIGYELEGERKWRGVG